MSKQKTQGLYNTQGQLLTVIVLPQLAECETNRIYHWSSIQTEKSQPEGEGIMPEMRFTEFPALSVDSRIGITGSSLEIGVCLFFLPVTFRIITYHLFHF